jgi:hypothetical protein
MMLMHCVQLTGLFRAWSKCTTQRFYPNSRSCSTSPSGLYLASTLILMRYLPQQLCTQLPVHKDVRPFQMLGMLLQLGQMLTQGPGHPGPRRELAPGHLRWDQQQHHGLQQDRVRNHRPRSQILRGRLRVPWPLQELLGLIHRHRRHPAVIHLQKRLGRNKMRY